MDTAAIAARGGSVSQTTRVLLDAGVRIVQYRHKDPWTEREYDEAARMAEQCRENGTAFVLNDRADYAHLFGAGLHVGQEDLHPVPARLVVGPECIVGFSTHNRRQLLSASEEPVDYIALGPIFATASKLRPDPVLGVEAVSMASKQTTKPLVAIGGITLATAPVVLSAGAHSVATVSGYLPQSADLPALEANVRQWLQLCGKANRD